MSETTAWVTGLLAAVGVIFHAGVVVVALGVLPGNRKPSTAMAWLILILAVPYLGILVFLLFGRTSVGRRRREWQRQVNERVLEAVGAQAAAHLDTDSASGVRDLALLNQRLAALPLAPDNSVEVITDYAGSIAAMAAEVDLAQRFVHVEFYISSWDDVTDGFFRSMEAAAERGVEVRFLFDHLGSRGIPGYREFTARLDGTGIRWAPMLPISLRKGQLRRPDLRNHRKLLVVDGAVAFMGSQNLIEPGYDKPKNHQAGRRWVELMTRVTGPVVRQLNVVFASDWFAETGEDVSGTLEEVPPGTPGPGAVRGAGAQIVPSGPGFATENNLRLFNSMVYRAHRRLSLTSPYFVPDESMLYAVTTAAQRGVEVELFVSEEADQFMVAHAQRSYYQGLLEAGVRIWLYPSPFVLHAKHFTVDDDLAVIGSSNMDYRSFALNYEVVMMVTSPDVVRRLERVQHEYRALSRELSIEEWLARGRGAAYVDNVMRLTAALQ